MLLSLALGLPAMHRAQHEVHISSPTPMARCFVQRKWLGNAKTHCLHAFPIRVVRPVSQSNRARDRTPVIHSCQNQSRALGPLSLPSIAVDPLAIKATAQYKRRWILVHINTTQATPRCHKCNTHIKAINAVMLGVCHGHTAKLLAIKAITQHQRCWILVNTVAIKATP